jgi:pilus assembly protein CpaE
MAPTTQPSRPSLRRCVAGVTAIEFAIFAPMIFLGLLTMVDIGRSITVRMEMDRNVRAGAQAAMSLNNDLDSIEGIILASTENPDELTVDVAMECRCAVASAACTTPCPDATAPAVFVAISALRPYEGILLPARTIASRIRVQIR